MIKELRWDSVFFKRKIGELTVTPRTLHKTGPALKKAKKDGFKYIICRCRTQTTFLIKQLEASGFYLSDIGITFEVRTRGFLADSGGPGKKLRRMVKTAADKDIPELKKISTVLFTDSRFYNDPFFSKKEADGLYRIWTENSVKKRTADAVLWIPGTGFVTCKKAGNSAGKIILIGIKKNFRNKGAGTILLDEAMKWFKRRRVRSVSTRTQINNLAAINFYLKSGFRIKSFDIVLAKIL